MSFADSCSDFPLEKSIASFEPQDTNKHEMPRSKRDQKSDDYTLSDYITAEPKRPGSLKRSLRTADCRHFRYVCIISNRKQGCSDLSQSELSCSFSSFHFTLVCVLHFTLSLHFTSRLQSAVLTITQTAEKKKTLCS